MGYKQMGDSQQLSFLFESGTYAIASGNRTWIGYVQNHDPVETMNVIPIRFQGGFSRNATIFTDGTEEIGGTFTYLPQDWKFLSFALGSAQLLGGSVFIRESDSDDANYAIPGQSLSTFTLEDAKKTAATGSNFIRTFRGCMIDSFKFSAKEGETISCEVGYIAQNVAFASGAVTAITPRTTRPYMWSNMNVQLPSGTRLNNCVSYDFTLNNNVERRYPLNGSSVVDSLIPLNRDYEVSATFLMDSDNAGSLYNNYYMQGNTFNHMVELKATAGSINIIMSGCRVMDMSIPSPMEGMNEITMTIQPANVYANVYDSIAVTGSYNAW
jgi:hypothetical protein